MSTRLQVVMSEGELEEIRMAAEHERMTVSEWVRQSLRRAREQGPQRSPRGKLEALEAATAHTFPTADIEQMLEEIARGRHSEPMD